MPAPALLSVKTSEGLIVGQATEVTDKRLELDILGTLELGVALEFRLELPGADETVRGTLRILAANGGRARAELVEVAPEDRAVFDLWWRSYSEGRLTYRPRVAIEGAGGRSEMHGASEHETGHALERIDERRARFAQRFAEFRGETIEEDTGQIFIQGAMDDESASLGVVAAPLSPGRRRWVPRRPVGSAASRTGRATPRARPTASPRPAPVDTRSARPAAPSTTHAPTAEQPATTVPSVPPPVQKPNLDMHVVPTTTGVAVTWSCGAGVGRSLAEGLAAGMLRLPLDADRRMPPRLPVHFVTPGGFDFEAQGLHIADDNGFAIYQVDIPADAQARLQREALQG